MASINLRRAKIAVELTSRCNLRCGMCPMDKLERAYEDMDWGTLVRVAAELRELDLRVRYLHEMGEPLLYPRLCEAIELFPGCCVSTNATLLDAAMGERLLGTSLAKIRLCIDTLDPEKYPIIRKGGKFDVVVANIRRFLGQARGKPIRIEIQRMDSKITRAETKADFERFFNVRAYANAAIIEKTCEGLDTSEETELHEAYAGCFQGSPYQWFVILANGDVTHCCYDYDGTQAIGNVHASSFTAIAGLSPKLDEIEAAFAGRDFSALPRCAECFRGHEGQPRIADFVFRAAQAVAPLKPLLRKLANVAVGSGGPGRSGH